jgi:hypothetical protein
MTQPKGATLADFADNVARENAGGRFGAVNTFIAQGEIPQYPRLPEGNPWASNPVPPEPPLGYAIDAMPGQVAEPGPTKDQLIEEIRRLRAMLEAARSGDAAPTPRHVERSLDEGDGRPGPSPLFSNQKEK